MLLHLALFWGQSIHWCKATGEMGWVCFLPPAKALSAAELSGTSRIIYSSEHKTPGKKSINSPMEDKSISLLWSKATKNNDQADRRSFARNFVGISISHYWIYPSYVSGRLQGKADVQVEKSQEGVNSKEKFDTPGQTQLLRASFLQHSAKTSDFRRDLFLFQLQISAQLLSFGKAGAGESRLGKTTGLPQTIVTCLGYLTENWQRVLEAGGVLKATAEVFPNGEKTPTNRKM